MPSEEHDHRRLSAMSASFEHDPFSEARRSHGQKEIGFWKSESNPDRDGLARAIASRNKPLTNFQSMPIGSHQSLAPQQSYFIREQNGIHGLQHLMGSEKKSVSTWKSTDFNFDFLFSLQSKPPNGKQNGSVDPGVLHENSLFSNSLPETFSQKVTSSSKNALFHQQTDELQSNLNEDGPFESLQEMEARTIGNLLPDDDDLFSGVGEFEGVPRSTNLDEDDIFGSLGGMELEIDDGISSDRGSKNNNINCSGESTGANGAYFGQHPHGEHPSRTLFVRNINSGVEDDELRSLFERYGDVQMLYTACKHRGFVMISYYDIRSASNAMKQLQNKLLRHRKLDIHYSIPKDNPSKKDINQGAIAVSNLESSVSNDELRHIFGVYGEIKEIWESPHKDHQKILEFYDSRVAEVTLRALDGKSIAGKQIKLEPSCPQFMTHCALMQQFPSDIEQGEADICQRGSGPDSSAGHLGTTPVQMNASIAIDNVSLQSPYPVPRGPINSIFGSVSNGLPSSFPHLLSSPIPSAGNLDNQSGIAGIEGALGSMNLSYQRMPNIHSHSLPERQNNFAMGILQNSPGIMQGMDANIGRHPEGIDGRHVNGSLPYDHGGAFGTPGSSGCPLHGHQYPRNRFPSYNPPHLGHVMWQNSPPFFSSIDARSPTQMQGFPRTSSRMPNNMAPFPHHVGSAPTTNVALWDRRHGYTGDVMEGSAFHPSSLGSMGFSASPTLHQMDLASRNIYPFGDGSCMESPLPSSHIGIPSPQNCQMFGGQNPLIHFNSRYDAPNDRMRNRRSDPTTNQGDNKKQFELDIERIVRGEDNRTTLMIKNIPNKYTSKMLLATIDEHHRGTYNFIYLPIDFKNKCNVGYAFINLIDPKKIIPFYETFNGKKWEKFNSEKVASLAYARIQGKSALVAHFQNSSLMNEDKRCRPILFHSDGPNAGDQEPFPMGSNIRSRTGRARIHNNDEDQQGSPPSPFGGEETSNEFSSPPRSKKSGES